MMRNVLLILLVVPAAAQEKGGAELSQALAKMESVGRVFRSFQAEVTQKKFTAVLREFDAPEVGVFSYARAKDGSALLRLEVLRPASRILTIKGGVATVFQPGIKQAQVVNLGKHKDKAEYLALGLGQSPGRLRESFAISYQGSETVAGAACWVLSLVPRSAAASAYFSSIGLWIKKSTGVPIQQRLQEPNGDYLLVTFSREKLNPSIPDSRFEQKLPAGTDIQRLR